MNTFQELIEMKNFILITLISSVRVLFNVNLFATLLHKIRNRKITNKFIHKYYQIRNEKTKKKVRIHNNVPLK